MLCYRLKVRIKILILLYFLSLNFVFSQDNIDIRWDVGDVGWGMHFSSKDNAGEITIKLFHLFIEHKKTNIGLIFNPFNVCGNYGTDDSYIPNDQANFLNLDFYWNFLGKEAMLFAPFVSINYFNLRQWASMDFADITFKSGLKFLLRKNNLDFENIMGSYTFRFVEAELGYRYNYFNGHKFYFNINIDLISLIFIIGSGSEMEKAKKANDDYERGIIR